MTLDLPSMALGFILGCVYIIIFQTKIGEITLRETIDAIKEIRK